jgi:hypothetical protein
LVLAIAALIPAAAATAAEVTPVVSARSPFKDFDFGFSAEWLHEQSGGAIKRESVQTTGALLTSDLLYRQTRDLLRLHGELALVQDLGFFVSGAIVLGDKRGLSFDGTRACAASGCESLIRDGFVPGSDGNSWGLDAEANRRFTSPSDQVFSGPNRSGLEYLGFGLRWAPLNQARDPMRPTWTVTGEMRLSVAGDRRFDPGKPTANRDVGLGYHQFILSTTFSHRFGAVEPYVGAWYMLPMLTSDSVYKNLGTGSFGSAQRRTGGMVGIEGAVWDNPELHARISLEAAGYLEYRFEGLAQSELWEVLSGDSRCASNASFCRPGIDVDAKGAQTPNAGVLRSPAYGLSGGDVGLSAHIGRHVRVRCLFGVLLQESHLLSDGGSGNQLYDIPGRRFKADGLYTWHVVLHAGTVF